MSAGGEPMWKRARPRNPPANALAQLGGVRDDGANPAARASSPRVAAREERDDERGDRAAHRVAAEDEPVVAVRARGRGERAVDGFEHGRAQRAKP